jgi:hypothetical protein
MTLCRQLIVNKFNDFSRASPLQSALRTAYEKKTGVACLLYRTTPSEGAGQIDLAVALETDKVGTSSSQ